MSHVDEGILHAYLDGELAPVEVERLESHLAGCEACRARLEEERVLIERASKLLGRAAPPEPSRAAPPLHELRERRRWWRIRTPLAWAATVVLALGIGWYTRGTRFLLSERQAPRVDSVAVGPMSVAAPAVAMDSGEPKSAPTSRAAARSTPEPTRPRDATRAEAEIGAMANRAPVREEHDEQQPAGKPIERLPQPQAQPEVRAPAPAPVFADGIVITQAAPARSRGRDAQLSTTWPVITSEAARPILGGQPATIPGLAIRDIRRDPFGEPVVLVEQVLDSGIVIQLYQRRADQKAAAQGFEQGESLARRYDDRALSLVKERLARFIGALRVEIAGPLPMDSLSRLLELVR